MEVFTTLITRLDSLSEEGYWKPRAFVRIWLLNLSANQTQTLKKEKIFDRLGTSHSIHPQENKLICFG